MFPIESLNPRFSLFDDKSQQKATTIIQDFSCSCHQIGGEILPLRHPTVTFLPVKWRLMHFVVATADGDRHGRSDGGSDRPRGRRGPEPSLPEGRKAEAVSQAEELKGLHRGGGQVQSEDTE